MGIPAFVNSEGHPDRQPQYKVLSDESKQHLPTVDRKHTAPDSLKSRAVLGPFPRHFNRLQNKIAPSLRCDEAMRREKMQAVGLIARNNYFDKIGR
jgi:hypothetical protein